ncbi:MAG: hypothetical protein ACI4N4_02830 [Candidatus Fimenecus sp.]
MKVFISWSGDLSLKVAQIFREWLPSVIQSIEPYVSSEDIDKGARWSTDIAKELENSTFGILCVTGENIEAPWLSFEAGALSKTMEKSFVTPFLFDIKRSDVKGPILQFQSTIFEKKDIKKLLKTLNKACGDSGISEAQLDKAFDVWYPTLETELTNIKSNINKISEKKGSESESHSSEILEEILDLSRDNQKLLRNPDSRIYSDLDEMKKTITQIAMRNSDIYERKRVARKYSSMMLEEIMHMKFTEERKSYGFLMILSLFRDDFPWIYDMGKEVVDIINSNKNKGEKISVVKDFKEMIDFTWGHPIMRDLFYRRDNLIISKDMPYMLNRYLDEMLEQYKISY